MSARRANFKKITVLAIFFKDLYTKHTGKSTTDQKLLQKTQNIILKLVISIKNIISRLCFIQVKCHKVVINNNFIYLFLSARSGPIYLKINSKYATRRFR